MKAKGERGPRSRTTAAAPLAVPATVPARPGGAARFRRGALVGLTAFVVYMNTLSNGFVFDDRQQVLENIWITGVRHLPEIFLGNVWGFMSANYVSNYYRPLMHAVYMAAYHVFGFESWGFHLVNVAFHVGNSLLVLVLASFLIEGPASRSARPSAARGAGLFSPALVAALLFAVHPIHTEAVAWVAGIPEISFTFFALLAFYFHVRQGPAFGRNHAVCLAALLLALLCKETAITMIPLLIAYDVLLRRRNGTRSEALARYAGFALVAGVYFVLRTRALGGMAPVKAFEPYGSLPAPAYAANALWFFALYMKKLVLPTGLNAFHVFTPVRSLWEWRGILGLGAALASMAAVGVSLRRNRLIGFAFLCILLPLAPAFLVPLYSYAPFSERYLYLPSVGLVLLAALGVDRLRGRTRLQDRALALAAVVLTGWFSGQTIQRNRVWESDLTLFTDTVARSPYGEIPNGRLGLALMEAGRLDEAAGQFRRTLRLNPESTKARYNLGLTLMRSGRHEEAIPELTKALDAGPGDLVVRANLADACFSAGKLDEAIAQYETLLKDAPKSAFYRNMLGIAYGRTSKYAEAIRQLEAAVDLAPAEPAYRRNLERARTMATSGGAEPLQNGENGGQRP